MPRLWLTYAWKDNEDADVDHVINELRAGGIDVGFDRAHLLTGERLWPQIDKALADPDLEGWAIYATEASLRSEPCQEELAYALDRVLRSKGAGFKLIGIFPRPIDREFIPSSIATRLYVSLSDPTWRDQIVDSLAGQRSSPDLSGVLPYGFKWHPDPGGGRIVELWPRSGRWMPCIIAVPTTEAGLLGDVWVGPRDYPKKSLMIIKAPLGEGQPYSGWGMSQAVTPETSLYAVLKERPSEMIFGQHGAEQHVRGII